MSTDDTPRDPLAPVPRGPVREYRKTATVMAGQASTGGTIPTLEGDHTYEAGDYIAGPGQAGEFWPVKRSIFEATYEPCNPLAAQIEDEDIGIDWLVTANKAAYEAGLRARSSGDEALRAAALLVLSFDRCDDRPVVSDAWNELERAALATPSSAPDVEFDQRTSRGHKRDSRS